MQKSPGMQEIHGTAMHYPWGTTDAIPAILGIPADGRPFAEYWLGAHPLAPSLVEGRFLDALVDADPSLLGAVAMIYLFNDTAMKGFAIWFATELVNFIGFLPLLLSIPSRDQFPAHPMRWLAQQFGELLGVEPVFINEETSHCLLSNASQAHRLFGYPRVGLRQMIEWTARWVEQGGEILGKPTHFQERQGRF